MSETSAGSIVAVLRMDLADFEAGIAKAQALADRLDGKNVDVNVKVETAGAEAKLAAVAASEDKVAKSSKSSSTGLDSIVASARKLSDASDRANVAQLRLGEMQGSGTAKASALAGAQNTLARAQRDVSDAMRNASPEAKRLADSMGKADLSNVKVVESNKKVASSSNDAGKGMGLMMTAVVGLGSAVVPLAVASTGLAVGLGAMGAAGIVALVGIKEQMAAGTPVGGAYTGMVATLKGDLTELGRTAATGVLAPFQTEVASLQTKMPALNGIIGEFSVITGKTAGALTTGLVAAFISLEPLARDAGVYVLNLSQRFAGLMSGGGVTTFGDYIRSVFPQVAQTVESVVGAAIRLVAALAPMGLGSLSILRTFADLINALPVNVLATLAQTAAAVYLGFAGFSALQSPIKAIGSALVFMGASAETAAAGVRGLTMAAGAIGVVIAIATLAFSAHAASVQADQDAVNKLTDALIANNGVIDASTIKEQANALAKDGTLAAAQALGYGLGDVTAASLGLADGTAKVAAHTNDLKAAWAASATTGAKSGAVLGGMTTGLESNYVALDKVTGATQDGKKHLDLATQAYLAYSNATATGTATTAAASTATLAQMTAQQQATSATQAQKTAILALNTALDAELSKELQLAGATSGFDQALLTMNTTLKTNKGTLNEHTQAGISDRQSIEQVVGSLQSQRDVQIKAGASTADATAKYQSNSVALLTQMGRLYGTKSAAYAYAQQLLAIPKSVSTAVGLNITPAMRALQALLATIPTSRTITMYVAAGANTAQALNYVGAANKRAGMGFGPANGAILTGFAAGGIQGFPTSESHVAQIAPAGAMRLWAEPETGGEAYIPLAPAKRARSTAILDEVGKVFGQSGGTDMSGVRADLAAVADEVRALGQVVHAELQAHARTTQTMRRQG
jgi:hypothetical protein